MSERVRVVCAAVGATGHVLPAIALARELQEQGHAASVLAPESWRPVITEAGLGFLELAEAPPDAELAGVARALVGPIGDAEPDVVVSEPFTHAPALAAEVAGVRTATLIPDPYPVPEPGHPVFVHGLLKPRTPVGAAAWRAAWPLAQRARREVRGMLNEVRGELGLPALERVDGAISDRLALVATFPHLEYPRRWPDHVHVTGPMPFDLDAPDPEIPETDEPLVVAVASTTGLESPQTFVEVVLEALADEPVRVVATLSRRGERWISPTPANATVVDWLALPLTLRGAAAAVCHGGHGTVAASLAAGVPVLVRPAGGNTGQIGSRVAWSGAGLMLPARVAGPGQMRWALRRLLGERRFAERAGEISAWSATHDGAARGAELVSAYARR